MVEILTDSAQLAEFLDCLHLGEVRPVIWATTLDAPQSNHLTFCTDPASTQLEKWNKVSGVIIGPKDLSSPASCAHVVSDYPRRDFGLVLREFFVPAAMAEIASSAVIHESAVIGRRVSIGSNSVVEEGVVLGDDVTIGHNTTVLARTQIGDRSTIGSNTVLGSVGFGLEKDDQNNWFRIPHIGRLEIGSDVEIGSSTVIARGTISATRIGKFCRIDDNVFIAHNVEIEENTVIIANSEISGSVKIGRNAWIAPGVTIIEGVSVGENTLVGIGSVVIRDIMPNVVAVGNPARVLRDRSPYEFS
jgi:UDP-3-O-[3-hydroxymyristoyl] glucosamine N-acyltransferase LpxD